MLQTFVYSHKQALHQLSPPSFLSLPRFLSVSLDPNVTDINGNVSSGAATQSSAWDNG